MKVTAEDSDLIYKLIFSLQIYVNGKLELIEGISTPEQIRDLSNEDKLILRDAVYENINLIDDYVTDNPDQLSTNELDIVTGWKEFVKGEFYIERHLKSYSIFLSDEKAYGVLAIRDNFDVFYPKSHLPAMVKTVLLPFKGGIIYDGLMQGYNLHFGGGIKRDLKETYMRAKQNDRILLSLSPSAAERRERVKRDVAPQKDWSKEIGQLVWASKKLKGGAGQPILNGQIFSLVKASVELANAGVLDSADTDRLLNELKKVERATSKLKNTLYRFD
jgi:hypothetical protein